MTQQTEDIWAALHEAGIVQGKLPETGKLESPWFVKVLLGLSGWLAACFLLGFIGMGFEFIFKSSAAAFIIGGMMIVGAFFLLRIRKNEFFEHLALAISLAGQCLVVWAIFENFNLDENIAWMLVALLQVTLAVVMPNFVHRVFSSFNAAFAFSMALTIMGWPYVFSGVVIFLAAWCWLNEFRYPGHMRRIRAIGYGQALALILLECTAVFGYRTLGWIVSPRQSALWTKPWIGEILIGAGMLYVVWHLLRRYNQGLSERISITALLGTLFLCAVSIEVQGITVGMAIMLLGFAGANRVLMGLGIVSLLFYISSYYYLFEATLLSKSLTLLVVGLALLIIRWLMHRILPQEMEVQHA